MTGAELVMVITAAGGLVGLIGTQIVLVINATKATKENTVVTRGAKAATEENTADRNVKAKAQVIAAEKLDGTLVRLESKVEDLHQIGVIAPAAAAVAPEKPATGPVRRTTPKP